jgi:2-dehydro-3-deoxygluconokinase
VVTGRVVTLGETMGVGVTERGERLRTAGTLRLSTAGAESTVAIGLARLGVSVAWTGVVGDDEIGARVLRDLTAEGVDVRDVRTAPGLRTGFMLRELRTTDVTAVTYFRSGSAGSSLGPADVDRALSRDVAVVHLTGITPALSDSCREATAHAVHLARDRGAAVSFDVNHRATLPGSARAAEFVAELLPHLDLLFVGDDELHVLGVDGDPEAAARALADRGPQVAVVKCGRRGAVAATADGAVAWTEAQPVQVLDAIGAGDSFVAGFLAARLDERPVEESLRWGAACGAATVAGRGDWEALPTREELRQRLLPGSGGAERTLR